MLAWTRCWTNSRDTGKLRRCETHMTSLSFLLFISEPARPPTSLFPIAELHWGKAIRRYGFQEPETLEHQWTSYCNDRIKFNLDRNRNQICACVGEHDPQLINYEHCLKLHTLLREGYRVKKTVFCRDDKVGVMCLIGKGHLNNENQKRRKHAVVAVDVTMGTVISCLEVKTSDGKENICDLEVWECDISPDGRLVVMAIAIMMDENFAQDSCENFVSIYDRMYNREVRRVWNWDNVICGVAFDPRWNHDQYALVGMRQTLKEKTALGLFEVRKKQPIRKVPIHHMIDRDGETYFQLRFSKDGEFLILQVIENIAYAREWSYKTLIYSTETLQLLCKCQPTAAISCHVDCVPRTFPILSTCNSHMALSSFRGKPNQSRTIDIDLYRLPIRLNLKHICRMNIISSMRDISNISRLPLPTSMKLYLQWCPIDGDGSKFLPREKAAEKRAHFSANRPHPLIMQWFCS